MLEKIKKYWSIGAIVSIVVIGTLWAADVQKKIDAIEQIQLSNKQIETKMFDFIMNLWKIDPEMRTKWKQIASELKIEDIDTVYGKGLDRLLKYKSILWVDTFYEYKDTL